MKLVWNLFFSIIKYICSPHALISKLHTKQHLLVCSIVLLQLCEWYCSSLPGCQTSIGQGTTGPSSETFSHLSSEPSHAHSQGSSVSLVPKAQVRRGRAVATELQDCGFMISSLLAPRLGGSAAAPFITSSSLEHPDGNSELVTPSWWRNTAVRLGEVLRQ